MITPPPRLRRADRDLIGVIGCSWALGVPWSSMTFDELMAWVTPDWQRDAACREHPDLSWFPTAGYSTTHQVAICTGCLVKSQCLADALDRGERYGLWGGIDSLNRMRLAGLAA